MVLPLYHDRYEVGVHGSVLPLVGIGVAPRVPVPPVISELEASSLNLRLRVSTGLRLMFLSLLWWLYHLALLVWNSCIELLPCCAVTGLVVHRLEVIEIGFAWLLLGSNSRCFGLLFFWIALVKVHPLVLRHIHLGIFLKNIMRFLD